MLAFVLGLALAAPPPLTDFVGAWKVRLYRVPRVERSYRVLLDPPQAGDPGLFGITYDPDQRPLLASLTATGRRFTLATQGDGFCHVLVGRLTRRGLRGRGRRYDATCTVRQGRVIQWEARR